MCLRKTLPRNHTVTYFRFIPLHQEIKLMPLPYHNPIRIYFLYVCRIYISLWVNILRYFGIVGKLMRRKRILIIYTLVFLTHFISLKNPHQNASVTSFVNESESVLLIQYHMKNESSISILYNRIAWWKFSRKVTMTYCISRELWTLNSLLSSFLPRIRVDGIFLCSNWRH